MEVISCEVDGSNEGQHASVHLSVVYISRESNFLFSIFMNFNHLHNSDFCVFSSLTQLMSIRVDQIVDRIEDIKKKLKM